MQEMVLSLNDAKNIVQQEIDQHESLEIVDDLILTGSCGWIIPYACKSGSEIIGGVPFFVSREDGTIQSIQTGLTHNPEKVFENYLKTGDVNKSATPIRDFGSEVLQFAREFILVLVVIGFLSLLIGVGLGYISRNHFDHGIWITGIITTMGFLMSFLVLSILAFRI